MHSLFWKGMLAFLAVILVAVGTVALVGGRITESEFRRYTFTRGGMWSQQISSLAGYYATHGSWEGVQDTLPASSGKGGQGRGGSGQGGGQGSGQGGSDATGPAWLNYRVADADGRVVGDTRGLPDGTSRVDLQDGIPVRVEDRVVGYLLPASNTPDTLPLDSFQTQFLARVETALWIAALAALAVALVVGGLLFRSIVAPLRRLTAASQTITAGDLTVRAPVQGQDEVAQLAHAFNRMAESLAHAEKARQNQTADIAHELRTPLTVLRGALEAMLDGIYPTDRENLLAALAQVQTLTRLVEDLRLLALADAGQLRLQAASLDLSAFLREIVEAHQLQAQERQVSLTLEMAPSLPIVQADRDRLAQVMGNLLGNALRYVSPGGHIHVRAVDRGREVIIAVADDGPGIPSQDLPHLFERFWRGDRARRRATGGSGLGLTIARSLVEAHSGRIWAESVKEQGSTFTFSLPIPPGS
jgi:two-component system sensor histidine kinase BaeS